MGLSGTWLWCDLGRWIVAKEVIRASGSEQMGSYLKSTLICFLSLGIG